MKRPLVIAEIGLNHNRSMDRIFEMLRVSAAANVSYVKFQTRTPDEDVPLSEHNILRRPPWNMDIEIPYIEYKRQIELTEQNYLDINEYCKKLNLSWTTSVWGETACDFITSLPFDLPALKLPSAKLTNHGLLRKVARWAMKNDREIWCSTGMSTQTEVDESIVILKEECGDRFASNVVLFNCNSSYPAKTTELNLSLINDWRNRYDCRIGYSSHSTTLGTTVAAGMLGYSHIEVHITFDREAPGSDHKSAVTYGGLFKLMSGLKDLEEAWGPGKKVLWDSELASRKKLRGT